MQTPFRAFAIVPAAGQSRRMGQPKLVLPWKDGTIIEATLAAWKASSVAAIVVVVRPDDAELAAICRRAGADVVVPTVDPPHMRDSVQHALDHIAENYRATEADVWMLAPADMPRLSSAIVRHLLAAHQPETPAILTPTMAGRSGHPVLFPWPLALQVPQLPEGRGINALHWQNPMRAVPCDELGVAREAFHDVDTPEQYDAVRPPSAP
jgi:molybdenum cofactor cytidylyltransferase